jgi:hypothetical protein
MTPQDIAEREAAELARWYALPSPMPPTRPDTRGLAVFGLCLACAVLSLIAHTPRGAY